MGANRAPHSRGRQALLPYAAQAVVAIYSLRSEVGAFGRRADDLGQFVWVTLPKGVKGDDKLLASFRAPVRRVHDAGSRSIRTWQLTR